MKIVVYGVERRVGAVVGDQVIDVNRACAKYLHERQGEPRAWAMANALTPADLGAFIDSGPRALEHSQKAIEYILKEADGKLGLAGGRLVHALSEVKLHAPKPSPASRIACAGGNYAQHSAGMQTAQGGETVTAQQMYDKARAAGMWGFWKVGREAVGPEEDVTYPSRTQRMDYEGEVAIILSKAGKDVTQAQAGDMVWGITLLCDWSIRDGRGQTRGMSFNLGKNFDTSTSIGPCVIVGELDPQNVDVQTTVNGDVRQKYNSKDMTFSFAEYIEYLSQDFTFLPGDVVSGGTGAGTAMDSSPRNPDGSSPPDRFLKPGDAVEVSSPQIGVLRNNIVAK
jgi:2-keto-4-pentenoate hydratase/2-oxohepta-3-ene-1,7-dioic acid hydratase in catechol pathway